MRPSWSCSPGIDCHQVKKGGKDLAEDRSKESGLTLLGSDSGIFHLAL